MPKFWNTVVAPSEEPVTLAEAKAHLRLDGSEEDALIQGLVQGAREVAEDRSGHAIITQTVEFVFDRFEWGLAPSVSLPAPPVQSIEWLRYIDDDNAEQTVDPAHYELYGSEIGATLALLPGFSLPSARRWKVRYVAGYGNRAAVPQHLKQGIHMLLAHWHENREATTDITLMQVPFAARMLFALNRATARFFD